MRDEPLGIGASVGGSEGDLVQILRSFHVFSTFDTDSLTSLAAKARMHHWDAGSLIFQRGDESGYFLAITGGSIRLSLATPEGRELVLRAVGVGEILGEVSVIDGQPRSADATALSRTSAILLRRDHFLSVARTRPDVGLAIAHHLCTLLRDTNYQLESIALFDLQMRLVRFILFTLRHEHGDSLPDEPVFLCDLNQSDLSAILGASRPKVNQALQNLIASGVMRRDGSKLICHRDRLEQLAAR